MGVKLRGLNTIIKGIWEVRIFQGTMNWKQTRAL